MDILLRKKKFIISVFFLIFFMVFFNISNNAVASNMKTSNIEIYTNLIKVEFTVDLKGKTTLEFPATFMKNSFRLDESKSVGIKSFNVKEKEITWSIKDHKFINDDFRKIIVEIDKLQSELDGLKFSSKYLDKLTPTAFTAQTIKNDINNFSKLQEGYSLRITTIERELSYKKKVLENLSEGATATNKYIEVVATGTAKAKLVFTAESKDVAWDIYYKMYLNSKTGDIKVKQYINIVQNTFLNLKGKASIYSSPITDHYINLDVNPQTVDVYKKPSAREIQPRMSSARKNDISMEYSADEMVSTAPATIADELGIRLEMDVNLVSSEGVDILTDDYIVKSDLDAILIPKYYDYTVLVANIAQFPKSIMRSKVDLFIDNIFKSTRHLDDIYASSQNIEIPFGFMESITAKVDKNISKTDVGFMKGTYSESYTITINNYNKESRKVKIEYPTPVSVNSKVEVKDLKISLKPTEINDEGIASWTLDLPPSSEQKIEISYTLKYPTDSELRIY